MLTVFVVSDASGETVEQVARAALVQFGDARVRLLRRGPVRTEEQVRAVSVLERIAVHLKLTPREKPGLLRQLAEHRRFGQVGGRGQPGDHCPTAQRRRSIRVARLGRFLALVGAFGEARRSSACSSGRDT